MSAITANFLLLLAAIIWGLGFVAQETAMDDVGPFQFVGLRFLIACLVVLPFAILEIKKHKNKNVAFRFKGQHYRQLFFVGFVFFIAMSLQQTALLGTSVTNTGMLTGLYVLFVPLFLIIFYARRQPFYIVICAIIAFVGIWLLGGGGLDGFTWGDWLALACAIFWALHVIVIGEAVTKFHLPVTFATFQFGLCGIIACLVFFILRGFNFTFEQNFEPAFEFVLLWQALPEILFASIFAGGLAFTLQAIAQRHTAATVAAVLLAGESLIAALGGAILLNERLDILGYLGCLCLFIAIVLTSYLSAKK